MEAPLFNRRVLRVPEQAAEAAELLFMLPMGISSVPEVAAAGVESHLAAAVLGAARVAVSAPAGAVVKAAMLFFSVLRVQDHLAAGAADTAGARPVYRFTAAMPGIRFLVAPGDSMGAGLRQVPMPVVKMAVTADLPRMILQVRLKTPITPTGRAQMEMVLRVVPAGTTGTPHAAAARAAVPPEAHLPKP
jgi:hypothetical protein